MPTRAGRSTTGSGWPTTSGAPIAATPGRDTSGRSNRGSSGSPAARRGWSRGQQEELMMLANICATRATRIRQLATNPGFTVVAILTLALGIGASTAIFSVVNGVLLRPMAYPNPDSLVRVHEILQKFGRFSVAPATFLDWRQQNTVFERIGALNSTGATLVGTDRRRAHRRRPRVMGHVRSAAGHARARPDVPSRRGRAREGRGDHPQPRHVAAAVRGRSAASSVKRSRSAAHR